MSKYYDSLSDKRWIKKRNRIFKRDNYKCTVCGSNKNIQVHHTYYYSNHAAPWEYPDKSLLTVCDKCHYDFHIHNETEIRNKKTNKVKMPKPIKAKKRKKKKQISLAEQQERRGLRIRPRKDIKSV